MSAVWETWYAWNGGDGKKPSVGQLVHLVRVVDGAALPQTVCGKNYMHIYSYSQLYRKVLYCDECATKESRS